MAVVCPTITAYTNEDYESQMSRIARFAHRVHIDLTDGEFTSEKSVMPENAWWQVGFLADFHLMYKDPIPVAKLLAQHKPHLIIVQAESDGKFEDLLKICQQQEIKVGAALLQQTPTEPIEKYVQDLDHIMIFSGNLGYQGGSQADLGLLEKVKRFKDLKPEIEIGWDGGVNDQNIAELILGGVDVINAGGFIHNSEDPNKAFFALQRIADETGTT